MTKSNWILLSVAVAALVVGAAYGDRIPLVKGVAPKLPGARA